MNNVEFLSSFLSLKQFVWNYIGSQKRRIRDEKDYDWIDSVVKLPGLSPVQAEESNVCKTLDASHQLQ